jgi:putative hydrolase of the HAD superfamily
MLRALFLDLDNTIYPVHSIGDALFHELFRMIRDSRELGNSLDDAKREIMRRPFQMVASEFGFSEELTMRGIEHLQQLEYKGPIAPFSDYAIVREIQVDKFLVTTGFTILQNSKVDGMGIRGDFREIHIVDPMNSSATKKDVFYDIVRRQGYEKNEVLVVGDDPGSEIRAAMELGLPTLLYDALDIHPDTPHRRITNYAELAALIKGSFI